MAKQIELRALINEFTAKVQRHTALTYDHVATQEQREEAFKLTKVAEQRIFSFFDQMRQTIDGLSADVERRAQVNRALTTERDEAVRQVAGLVQHMASVEHQLTLLEATNEKLRKGEAPVAEDTFVAFDPARNGEGLEALIGTPVSGEWGPATYIGATQKGFHVVEVTGRGVVVITDAAVGLRHRVKAKPMKTVTAYVNIWEMASISGQMGSLFMTEAHARRNISRDVAHAAIPVKVTVAE